MKSQRKYNPSSVKTISTKGRGSQKKQAQFKPEVILVGSRQFDPLRAARKALLKKRLMPTECLYSPLGGAMKWLDLCSDHSFDLYKKAVRHVKKSADSMLDACGENFFLEHPNFVSLGPGNGEKDKAFLKAIAKRSANHTSIYCPLDVSFALLEEARNNIYNTVALKGKFSFKLILATFASLPHLRRDYSPIRRQYVDHLPGSNLFSLLGNSLGNMPDEIRFLRTLRATMKSMDRAIIEVRLTTGLTGKAGGEQKTRSEHAFTPLGLLGVEYDWRKFEFKIKEGLGRIKGTKTLVSRFTNFHFGDRHIRSADLYWIHHYDLEEFRKTLSRQFNVLGESLSGPTGYFIIENKPDRLS